MSVNPVKKILRGNEFSFINWQKEFKVTPDQFFSISVSKVEKDQMKATQTSTDGTVEIDGKTYQLEMSPDLSMTEINSASGGFDFLKDEPDLYSTDDLKKSYV